MARSKTKQLSYITVPAKIIRSLSATSLQSLLITAAAAATPGKQSSPASPAPPAWIRQWRRVASLSRSPRSLLLLLLLFFSVATLRLGFDLDPLLPFSPIPCSPTSSEVGRTRRWEVMSAAGVEVEAVGEFWKQPDGMGYRPCLNFSEEYKLETEAIRAGRGAAAGGRRKKYLVAVVSGGLNQQRNQIVDAVVIARILGAALVMPVLQVNVVWGDESEFSDIFDFEHFKKVLADDVKVVSSLPSTHIMTRPVDGKRTPLQVSPQWLRSRYTKRLNREGVLLLRSLDSRLSKDLPSDLQKLRCKAAFEALRFAAPIQELGERLAMRMRSKGPYIALHLRLEKDVWIRTGCLPGLTSEYDEIIQQERKLRPELLTARSNMTYNERKLAGLCPLNALEVTRLLKALGAPSNSRIYWAGGEPFGGALALEPLLKEFPHLYSKENISLPGELEPLADKASLLAAIDYIVCEKSEVFMPSHGGNMGHLMHGHRAFAGHRKYITPNKRQMLPYFLDSTLPESEFDRIIRELHEGSLGQPEVRTEKNDKDVTAYPVPECMCNGTSSTEGIIAIL